jgi:two-component system, NtrC family, response regulator GlrR
MVPSRILILAEPLDHPLGAEIQAILQQERRYRVTLCESLLSNGTMGVDAHPDLIILVLPISLARANPLLTTVQRQSVDTPLLLVVRTADLTELLDEMLRGPMDFLGTPLQEAEMRVRVRRLLRRGQEPAQEQSHARQPDGCGLAHLVGEDPTFMAVKRKLPLMARDEAPVLLTGETGTGKELCARALHYLSRRAGKPFLPVNCGAIPVELFERELFGHAKGAFTGAWAAQPGLIAEAKGGTLFLDEIETLSLSAQVKLLRFLQDQTYHALGTPRLQQADVWILAATNMVLPQKVQDGTFRADLFYRLAVLSLTLPPLRERPSDIPRLVSHVWARYADQRGSEKKQLSPRALEALCRYTWPGNIRELENVLRQALVLTDAQTIEPEDLAIPLPHSVRHAHRASLKQAKAEVIDDFERVYLADLLRVHHGNVTQAARAAQTERRAFGRLLKKHHIAKS